MVANICNLNKNLATKVKDLEATEHIQESPSRELAAAQHEIHMLEEELQIRNRQSAELERLLGTCKS